MPIWQSLNYLQHLKKWDNFLLPSFPSIRLSSHIAKFTLYTYWWIYRNGYWYCHKVMCEDTPASWAQQQLPHCSHWGSCPSLTFAEQLVASQASPRHSSGKPLWSFQVHRQKTSAEKKQMTVPKVLMNL